MFSISKSGIVTVSRGDTFSINVFINLGTDLFPLKYILQPGDKLYFALMEPNQPFEHAIMRREFTNEDLNRDDEVVMNFPPDQTEYLMPGTYYYTVKLARKNLNEESGSNSVIVDTIIGNRKFILI